MSLYKYVRNVWKKPKKSLGSLWRKRIIDWKDGPVTIRVARPTRIDRARSLGYKAKQGYLIVRQRLLRQKRMRPTFGAARRSKHMRRKKVLNMSYQWIAEQRVSKKFVNCEVLNSYFVAETGKFVWYEVILIDRAHPVIKADKNIHWICSKRGRAQRGLTSAAKRSMVK